MTVTAPHPIATQSVSKSDPRLTRLMSTRAQSLALAAGLSDADATVQSMPDASPTKWHLAHTSWFFEEFVLCGHLGQTDRFDDDFSFLFNSYYDAVGSRHERHRRGLLSRPSLDHILAYRQAIDDRLQRAFSRLDENGLALIDLGIAHEQQHQELLLTDLLHLFAQNPIRPVYREAPGPRGLGQSEALSWITGETGVQSLGTEGHSHFVFDCETPRHDTILTPHALANRSVTNAEWIAFIGEGGYETVSLWLSDGWAVAKDKDWRAPLYWEEIDGVWHQMTLHGFQPVDPAAPVCHVSFYEADAFASWASAQWNGARLASEAEWEIAARTRPVNGHFAGSGLYHPTPHSSSHDELAGLFGDVWEWTSTPFRPYPGFRAASGAVGEYNGKFMSGQYVLRGGSCATPDGHIRPTYRNFFHPEKRWQFSGLRLARDL